jgi:Family of unknown function (DUF6152)
LAGGPRRDTLILMKNRFFALLIALCAGCAAVWAHHSFAAEFDGNKAIKLEGTLTKLEWFNPHIWLYLDVKDASGTVVKWQCEGGAPNGLTRNGWSKDSLKAGDQLTIEGWLAKDGSRTCNARSVKLPDGRRVFAGSSNPDAKE